ncbi:MAG TPA: DHA2 family efflux MFS transporter permease subunit [Gammaproteobacteria bacterium]|nr:DHA2 family efflux MFS transporter permease subunit [Gammaproteobacteria bacterium]
MASDAGENKAPLAGGQLAIVTVALALAVFMNVLDISIANVSIPTIAGELAVSPDQGTWVITFFAVANAIAVPVSGWLARQVGEVRLFVVCTLLFTLFSWFCGLAFTFPMLLACRALQGATAGPMIPLSQSLLLSCYPNDKRGFANGVWGMTAVVGPVAGPILGGWITEHINWSWIFYINVPIGLLAAGVSWVMLRDRETAITRQRIDGVGLLLLAVGVGSLQVMLDQGNDKAWFQSTYIVTLALISLVTLSFFVVWELTADRPIVELHLFGDRNFAIATTALCFGYMAFFSAIVILPLWLQTQMGYTSEWAGYATASLGLLGAIFSPISGRLADKVDPRILVTTGFVIFAAVSFYNSGFNDNATFWQLFVPRLPWGVGTAFFFIPLITLAFSRLPVSQVASASGLFNFLRQISLGFGTSLSVTLWDKRATLHDHRLTSHLTAFDPATTHWLAQAREAGISTAQAYAKLASQVSGQAFMLATNDLFYLSGWLFLLLIGLIWLASPVNGRGRE